jgi:hypothetical protein
VGLPPCCGDDFRDRRPFGPPEKVDNLGLLRSGPRGSRPDSNRELGERCPEPLGRRFAILELRQLAYTGQRIPDCRQLGFR